MKQAKQTIIDTITMLIAMAAFVAAIWLLCPKAEGQTKLAQPCASAAVWIRPEAAIDKLHDKLVFYRIKTRGQFGEWHLFTESDKEYLSGIAKQIVNEPEYGDAKIEWTSVEGKLPK